MIVSKLSNTLFQISENRFAISKLSVVFGATGGQAGFVVHAMLADPNIAFKESPSTLDAGFHCENAVFATIDCYVTLIEYRSGLDVNETRHPGVGDLFGFIH